MVGSVPQLHFSKISDYYRYVNWHDYILTGEKILQHIVRTTAEEAKNYNKISSFSDIEISSYLDIKIDLVWHIMTVLYLNDVLCHDGFNINDGSCTYRIEFESKKTR